MKMRPLALLAAALLLGGLAWTFLRSDGPPPTEPSTERETTTRPAAPPADGPDLAETEATDQERSIAPIEPSAAAPAATTAANSARADHPWAGSFAGVTGRLVETNGDPVEGLVVELFQFDAETVFADGNHPVTEELCMGTGTSGADGRFTIGGARGMGFHALAIDPGGGRYTIRALDASLAYGETTDVGDIVLQPGGIVVGTVVDEDGDPVEGARVRFAPVPEVVVQSGALDLRSDSLLAISQAGALEVVDVAAKYRGLLDRLPAATGFTDAEGAFRIDGVALGRVTGGADAPGHVAGPVEGVMVNASGETDVGEIELLFGRTITGKVVDAADQPVAGAEVRVGALSPLAPAGLLQPGTVTGPDGTFELEGVPEEGQVIGAARRGERDEWSTATATGISESVTLRLPSVSALRVQVTDAEGAPVREATLKVQPSDPPGSGMGGMGFFAGLSGITSNKAPRKVTAEEVEPGIYVVADLSHGWYELEATAPGYGLVRERHHHVADGPIAELQCGAPWNLSVRVVDAATGEPVDQAHVLLLEAASEVRMSSVAGWSDEEGRAVLGPLGDLLERPGRGMGGPFEGYLLDVEHPGYARAFKNLPNPTEASAEEIEVRLEANASIEGRITWVGDSPQQRYMISLDREGDGSDGLYLPSFTASAEDGTYRFSAIPPGTYDVELTERFLDRDPLSFIVDPIGPSTLTAQRVRVAAGQTVVVNFELEADGQAAPGWFEGRVRVNGQIPPNTYCRIGWGDDTLIPLDGAGRFKTEELDPSERVQVTILEIFEVADQPGETGAASGSLAGGALESFATVDSGSETTREGRVFFRDYMRPGSGVPTVIDVDVQMREVTVNAVDSETLEPIVSASVSISTDTSNASDSTDDDGRVTLEVPGTGDEVQISVYANGYQSAEARVDLGDEGLVSKEVKLRRAVPCAGTVILPPGVEIDSDNLWMVISEDQTSGFAGDWAGIKDDLTFELDAVAPGKRYARLWLDGTTISAEFEVPEGGSDTIVIDFSER